jgi:hypothetical protein
MEAVVTIRYKAWITRREGGRTVESFCEIRHDIDYFEDGFYRTTDFDYKEIDPQPETKPEWKIG